MNFQSFNHFQELADKFNSENYYYIMMTSVVNFDRWPVKSIIDWVNSDPGPTCKPLGLAVYGYKK